jgi:hypothetical protein
MLALVGATAAAQRGTRRTAEEQREALAAFKQRTGPEPSMETEVREVFAADPLKPPGQKP